MAQNDWIQIADLFGKAEVLCRHTGWRRHRIAEEAERRYGSDVGKQRLRQFLAWRIETCPETEHPDRLRQKQFEALCNLFGLESIEVTFRLDSAAEFENSWVSLFDEDGKPPGDWKRDFYNCIIDSSSVALRPDLVGLGLEEGQSSSGEPRPILVEMAFGNSVELVEDEEPAQPALRVALELTRVALCFEFEPQLDPPMRAKLGSRLGRESAGYEIEPATRLRIVGDPEQPKWIVEADGEEVLKSFSTTKSPLFLLENADSGGAVTAWAMICAKDCALVPRNLSDSISEQVLSVAQQKILTILETRELFSGGRFDRVVNRKKLSLKQIPEMEGGE